MKRVIDERSENEKNLEVANTTDVVSQGALVSSLSDLDMER